MNFTSDAKRNRNVQIGLAEQVVHMANLMMNAPTTTEYSAHARVLSTVVAAAKEAGVSIHGVQRVSDGHRFTEIKAAEQTFILDFQI